jgi:hypothetical protein
MKTEIIERLARYITATCGAVLIWWLAKQGAYHWVAFLFAYWLLSRTKEP